MCAWQYTTWALMSRGDSDLEEDQSGGYSLGRPLTRSKVGDYLARTTPMATDKCPSSQGAQNIYLRNTLPRGRACGVRLAGGDQIRIFPACTENMQRIARRADSSYTDCKKLIDRSRELP